MPILINREEEPNKDVLSSESEDVTPSIITENDVEMENSVLKRRKIGEEELFLTDKEAPLVILYGPTSCGKTMTLIRLSRYLHNDLKFTIEPDLSFRPSDDYDYKEACEAFKESINNPLSDLGTKGYMLVNVIEHGRTLCKLLEAPGEFYFDPQEPDKTYYHYLQTLITAPNRKVWCVFVEPHWQSQNIRDLYVTRIANLKYDMSTNDRIIFVLNKIDLLKEFVINPGVVRTKYAMKYTSDNYQNIFEPFRCTLPIISLFRKYDCGFIPFQAGVFSKIHDRNDGRTAFSQGNVKYVKSLWTQIKKSI